MSGVINSTEEGKGLALKPKRIEKGVWPVFGTPSTCSWRGRALIKHKCCTNRPHDKIPADSGTRPSSEPMKSKVVLVMSWSGLSDDDITPHWINAELMPYVKALIGIEAEHPVISLYGVSKVTVRIGGGGYPHTSCNPVPHKASFWRHFTREHVLLLVYI